MEERPAAACSLVSYQRFKSNDLKMKGISRASVLHLFCPLGAEYFIHINHFCIASVQWMASASPVSITEGPRSLTWTSTCTRDVPHFASGVCHGTERNRLDDYKQTSAVHSRSICLCAFLPLFYRISLVGCLQQLGIN